MARERRGPNFVRYFDPVLDALKELGGSGSASEVTDLVLSKMGVSEEEQSEVNKNGQSKVRNQVAWARFYLTKGGLLDSSQRGVWRLTDDGAKTRLSPTQAIDLFKSIQSEFKEKAEDKDDAKRDLDEEAAEESGTISSYRKDLLDLLLSLPPQGFERLCKRLLRESGFDQVEVTGRSGDGGIDGHGVLQVNPFVSFRILFQCKRYRGTVSPSQIRDFRGAMQGRAEKGIVLTTGSFTLDAKKEARRDGVPQIELVDGEKLIDMFESLELGLKPTKTYELDHPFFKDFSDQLG